MLERLRDAAMQQALSRRSDIRVCDLANAVVAEVPTARVLRTDDMPPPQLVDGADEILLLQIARVREHVEREVAADHRRQFRDLARLRRQLDETRDDDGLHTRRERSAAGH